MTTGYPLLFSEAHIGPLRVKNRIVFGAHGTSFPFFGDDQDPSVYIEYQRERAKGGCGLAIIGSMKVHASSASPHDRVPSDHPLFVSKLRQMSSALHDNGTGVFLQLAHTGMRSSTHGSMVPWSLSGGPAVAADYDMTHEMTKAEIHQVIDAYCQFTRDARDGELDGVEIDATHGNITQQSWSPWANSRTDEYGEQMRFANELIDRMRDVAGPDLVIGIRISSDDWMPGPGGMGSSEMQTIAKNLEATGKIDYISLSGGSTVYDYARSMPTMNYPPAPLMDAHAAITASVTKIPVLGGGGVGSPALAEELLAAGKVDMVWLVRALIADPEWPKKASSEAVNDIRLCIYDNSGCADRRFAGLPVRCLQNAASGREYLGPIARAEKPKTVVVVGGGVGGMEAARVADLRGHRVILFEKAEQVGGQVNLIKQMPARRKFGQVATWLERQIAKTSIEVKLSTEATADRILEERPDAVIVATGSVPSTLDLPDGVGNQTVSIWEALSQPERVGQSVLVFDRCGTNETSYFITHLLNEGKRVVVATPFLFVGFKTGRTNLVPLQQQFHKHRLQTYTSTTLAAIDGRTVVLKDLSSGVSEEVPDIDTVIAGIGNRSVNGLARDLDGLVPKVHVVGDAVAHRAVLTAVHEAYDAVRAL